MPKEEDKLQLLGRNLRRWREYKKKSQQEIAEKFGCKQSYISKLENGEINITYTQLLAYCKAIGASLIQII